MLIYSTGLRAFQNVLRTVIKVNLWKDSRHIIWYIHLIHIFKILTMGKKWPTRLWSNSQNTLGFEKAWFKRFFGRTASEVYYFFIIFTINDWTFASIDNRTPFEHYRHDLNFSMTSGTFIRMRKNVQKTFYQKIRKNVLSILIPMSMSIRNT